MGLYIHSMIINGDSRESIFTYLCVRSYFDVSNMYIHIYIYIQKWWLKHVERSKQPADSHFYFRYGIPCTKKELGLSENWGIPRTDMIYPLINYQLFYGKSPHSMGKSYGKKCHVQ